MQAAFHTKNIGSLMLRPGGSVEVLIIKDRKMSSKYSIEILLIKHFVPHFLANWTTTEIIKAY